MKTTKISRFEAPDPDAGMTYGELVTIIQHLEAGARFSKPVMAVIADGNRYPIRALEIITDVQDH